MDMADKISCGKSGSLVELKSKALDKIHNCVILCDLKFKEIHNIVLQRIQFHIIAVLMLCTVENNC